MVNFQHCQTAQAMRMQSTPRDSAAFHGTVKRVLCRTRSGWLARASIDMLLLGESREELDKAAWFD
jgi:hypothetical protein